ncbi:MAG: hypothetical protein PHC28_07895 [Flavobacterium sp.]|uniref:hypothetical protein n=1 Tax=Flavobacterium sp. TaxID=239 RepID=UPI0026270D4F|nr:hypothetical protein [Flavobacterium sp.]MDD5150394.1 hypothetical protein [Flavobacterium sp.]
MTKKQLAAIARFKEQLSLTWKLDRNENYLKTVKHNGKEYKFRIKFNKISYRVEWFTSLKEWRNLNNDTKYLKDIPISGEVVIGNGKIVVDTIIY